MKLFAVKRNGEDKNGSVSTKGCIDKEREKKRLAELLAKVNKRRENAKKNKIALKQQAATFKAEKEYLANSAAIAAELAKKEENKPEIEKEEPAVEPPAKRSRKTSENLQPDGFTVIGKDHFKRVKEAKAVLPRWLAQPTIVSVDMKSPQTAVESLPNLSPALREKLVEQGVHHFFAVQSEVIPWLLQEYKNSLTGYWPRDICVSAPTGSGKTLAFVLPIIEALQSMLVREIRALVVLPVQDLAKQVFGVFRTYCAGTGLKVVLATGQGALHDEQRQLVIEDVCGSRAMADIVVTTPGRLVHHLRDTHGLSLRHLRFLVVDEADRVMDGVQSDWLYHLERHLASEAGSGSKDAKASQQPCQAPGLSVATLLSRRAPPQKLLFSATLSQDPEKLAQLGLFQPRLFTCVVKNSRETTKPDGEDADPEELARGDFVGKFAMPAEIREHFVICEEEGAKPLLLHCLLVARARKHQEKKGSAGRTLCFASSRTAAHRLALLLSELSAREEQPTLRVAEISAGLRFSERDAILSKFTNGELDVIVCSDALARGIDVPGVDCVVSYDAPPLAKLYIHRVGRTGRAGRRGTAITLLVPQQQASFEHMLRNAGKHKAVQALAAPLEAMEALEEPYLTALASVKQHIQREEANTLESSKAKKTNTKKKKSKKTKSSSKKNFTGKDRFKKYQKRKKVINKTN